MLTSCSCKDGILSASKAEEIFFIALHITERLLQEGPCLKIIFILILKYNKVNDLNLK